MKIAAALTLYHPTKENITNILQYINFFDYIYIYDNSENNNLYCHYFNHNKKINYIYNGKNDGLPVALNKMKNLAIGDNMDYLCTLDQDSVLTKKTFDIIKYDILNLNFNIGIICPRIKYQHLKLKKVKERYTHKKWCICSGSFLNLKLIKKYNISYDEYYFIDRFEIDFCHQLNKYNLKIICDNYAVLNHQLGEEEKRPSHLPYRYYLMSKNRFYYYYKYYNVYIAFLFSIILSSKQCIYIILFEKDKLKKIISTINGIVDFYRGG